jgi:hypothetical protein
MHRLPVRLLQVRTLVGCDWKRIRVPHSHRRRVGWPCAILPRTLQAGCCCRCCCERVAANGPDVPSLVPGFTCRPSAASAGALTLRVPVGSRLPRTTRWCGSLTAMKTRDGKGKRWTRRPVRTPTRSATSPPRTLCRCRNLQSAQRTAHACGLAHLHACAAHQISRPGICWSIPSARPGRLRSRLGCCK